MLRWRAFRAFTIAECLAFRLQRCIVSQCPIKCNGDAISVDAVMFLYRGSLSGWSLATIRCQFRAARQNKWLLKMTADRRHIPFRGFSSSNRLQIESSKSSKLSKSRNFKRTDAVGHEFKFGCLVSSSATGTVGLRLTSAYADVRMCGSFTDMPSHTDPWIFSWTTSSGRESVISMVAGRKTIASGSCYYHNNWRRAFQLIQSFPFWWNGRRRSLNSGRESNCTSIQLLGVRLQRRSSFSTTKKVKFLENVDCPPQKFDCVLACWGRIGKE